MKVWNASRNVRKALVVGTYEEFLRKGMNNHLLMKGNIFVFVSDKATKAVKKVSSWLRKNLLGFSQAAIIQNNPYQLSRVVQSEIFYKLKIPFLKTFQRFF